MAEPPAVALALVNAAVFEKIGVQSVPVVVYRNAATGTAGMQEAHHPAEATARLGGVRRTTPACSCAVPGLVLHRACRREVAADAAGHPTWGAGGQMDASQRQRACGRCSRWSAEVGRTSSPAEVPATDSNGTV